LSGQAGIAEFYSGSTISELDEKHNMPDGRSVFLPQDFRKMLSRRILAQQARNMGC